MSNDRLSQLVDEEFGDDFAEDVAPIDDENDNAVSEITPEQEALFTVDDENFRAQGVSLSMPPTEDQ